MIPPQTGDSQEEVIIFRYKQTHRQTLIIIYISSTSTTSTTVNINNSQIFRIFKLARVLKLARHSPGLQVTLFAGFTDLGHLSLFCGYLRAIVLHSWESLARLQAIVEHFEKELQGVCFPHCFLID